MSDDLEFSIVDHAFEINAQKPINSLVCVTTIVGVLQPNDQGLGLATQQSTGALVDRLERVLGPATVGPFQDE
jgi:hypothetical protein